MLLLPLTLALLGARFCAGDLAEAPTPIGPISISFLPRPRFVVLGQQGVGKSSLSNALMGYDNTAKNKKQRAQSPFKVGHGLKSVTQMTTFSVGTWLGGNAFQGLKDNITIVDTPGFKDTKDSAFVEELTSVLGDEVPSVDTFLVVFKYKDRFTAPFKRTLNMISKMFGNIWDNVVVVVSFWDYGGEKRADRRREGTDEAKYKRQLQNIFKKQIGALNAKVPVVFLDSHFSSDDPMEVAFFQQEAQKLRQEVKLMKPFPCLKRADIQKKLRKNKSKLANIKKKDNKRRRFLETQVRNLTQDALASKSMIAFYQTECPGRTPGCKWGEWSDFSKCEASRQERTRARLVGETGMVCDGQGAEVLTGCTVGSDMSDNWLEHKDTVSIVLGGRNVDGDILADAQLVTRSGGCPAPGLPVSGLEMMTGAYSKAGGLMVCGGKDSDERPSDKCFTYVQDSNQWDEAQGLPVGLRGAASAWLNGKLWIFGGSSSSQATFTLNQNVYVFDPLSSSWETDSTEAGRHALLGTCALTLEPGLGMGLAKEALVLTGGSKRGLNLNKRNSGIKAAYIKTEEAAASVKLPPMRVGRSFHGCAVSTIEGSLGVVVGGGSADGDSVEFLNLETRKKWVKIGVLARQRIYGPVLAHIGGRLSMLGGYNWPSTVAEVEQLEATWEHDSKGEQFEEGWFINPQTLDRAFHTAITVPARILPACPENTQLG